MKKRILVCCNRTLNFGGIEKSLTTFLGAFDYNEYDLHLVIADLVGPLSILLPQDNLTLFCTNSIQGKAILLDDIRSFNLKEIFNGLWNRIMLRFSSNWYAKIMYNYNIRKRKLVFPGPFDCAISFSTDFSDLSMVVNANARLRIAFVHADATQNLRAAKLNNKLFKNIDRIFCVSESSKASFLKVHPSCANKMGIFYNILDRVDILEKADEEIGLSTLSTQKNIICTVGRLSFEKGQHLIPKIAEKLVGIGKDFHWIIVGDGSLRSEIEAEINKRDLSKFITLVGGKSNPYPYIKNCNLYVQTSFTEAYCITTAEAKVLGKPIVTTNIPCMYEQFTSGENGLIVDATPEALFEGIRTLLDNPSLVEKFSKNLSEEMCDNSSELNKLYSLIEGVDYV